MFEELQTELITEQYKSQRGVFLVSTKEQLSTAGYVLDLNSLPQSPIPFKELFIRWLIAVNYQRITNGQEILATYDLVIRCPIWRLIPCPIRKLKFTPEAMFNKPKGSKGSIGSIPTKSINKRK